MTIELRRLLKSKNENILYLIDKIRKLPNKKSFIYLPYSNEMIQKGYEEAHKSFMEYGGGPDVKNLEENTITKHDGLIFEELKKSGIIKDFHIDVELIDTPTGMDEYWGIRIKGVDKKNMDFIWKWIQTIDFVLNYGVFSINTLTGMCFCGEDYYRFKNNSGRYRVMKSFIEKKSHSLSFEELNKEFEKGERHIDLSKKRIQYICKSIGYIKRDIGMKKGSGKEGLFIKHEDRGYTLLPGN